ncbi:hypothetical protein FOL47_005865 [Perkinsus chesapeaki]|uniref:Uncharacterized protein n=1 Tax=Perkinsus chesapeaki TaxID=330153 RepID=A0A7J6LVF7_PERCH|nr:hypothetical protein FOL47_005865 [Perkinsus chesapeaki]
MAVQSLTPTDGGPPLPHDLIELDKPPLDGYGYYGEEELRYLAMVNDALITQYDDDEEDEEDYGTNNRSPRVQAAIELWQGENQLYGVGRIALDLAPRDLSALSNRALVRMEALVDCVSGWSGAILATCQLLVDVSSDRVPLENALQMRFKHHIFNDNKEQRKKKLTNRSGHHLDNSSSKSYIENEIMDEKQAASPKKLNDTLAVLKMNLRKSNEALLEELSDGPSSPGINAAAVGEEEELTSPQVLQRAVPIAAVIDGNSAAVDDVGDVGYDGKALLTSVGTSPIILPEEEEEKHPAASPTPPPTPSSNSTTRQDDSIISYRFIDDSMKGCTLNHHHHQLNHTSSSAVVALNDKESARLLPSRLDDNEQGGLSYYPRINNVGNGPGASSPVSHGHVGVSREEREQKEYVNMHLPYNIIPMSTTTTTRRRSISSTMMIDHGAAAVTNDDASDDNVPYADTETLLRALALMDEKVKYLTNRDTNVGVSSSSSPKVIAEITTVPRTAAITGSNTSSQHQAAAGGGDDASSDHCAVSDGIEVDGVEVMDIREEGDHDDVIARPEEQHIDESGGMSENPSNSGDESKVGMNDDIEKDDIGDDYGKEGVARIEVDDDENDGHTEKEEHSSTLRRIEELARRVVELETSTRSAAAATSTTTTAAAAAAPVVASQGYAGVNVATFSDDDDDAEEKSQTARNEGIYGEELEDNVMGHMKETRKRRSHSPIDQRKEENVDLHTEKASQAAPAAAGPAALASPQVPLMVDESISNPDSSLQEHISQGVIAAPSVESSSCSWLEEGPKMSSIRDTSLSPEIILEPAVRSPREITETRKYKAFEEAPLETVGRADDIVAIRHPTPVVDIEAIRQISRLNDRIAHLEVTAEEVVAKYKQAEARLLQNHHHLHQVNASRHVGDSQTFKFLPSESWIPFSDPPQPGRMGPSNTWHNKYKEVNGANISQCVEDRHHNSYEDEDEAGCYGKRKPPTSREVLCISEREYRHPHKPPASVRLEMKRALVRDAKRVAAILRGRDRLSLIDDDDEDDSD